MTTVLDGVLGRQFADVQAKWPGSLIVALDQGLMLSVPRCKLLNPKAWNRKDVTLAAFIPPGFPLSSPCDFYYSADLRLSHGGSPSATAETWEVSMHSTRPVPGFRRILIHMPLWRSNADTLTTVVNFMRVGLSSRAPDGGAR